MRSDLRRCLLSSSCCSAEKGSSLCVVASRLFRAKLNRLAEITTREEALNLK